MLSSMVSHAVATLDSPEIKIMDAHDALQDKNGTDLNALQLLRLKVALLDSPSTLHQINASQKLPHAVKILCGMELFAFVLPMLIKSMENVKSVLLELHTMAQNVLMIRLFSLQLPVVQMRST